MSETHRALRSESKLLRCFLLERARGEWRSWIFSSLAALYLGDAECPEPFQIGKNLVRLGFIMNRNFLVVDVMKLCGELLPFLLEKSFDAPVFNGLERFYLALSLDEKTKRHSLNATC